MRKNPCLMTIPLKADITTALEADVKPRGEKKSEETLADENTATGNSLSGILALTLLSLVAAGVAIKKRRK